MNTSLPTTRDSLIARHSSGESFKYLFFWGHQPALSSQADKSCLSQWFPAAFTVEGLTYPTAEHFMMAEKARLFGDEESLEKILTSADPGHAKRLGRSITGFKESIWAAHREEIVVRGNCSKFAQNSALATFLLSTTNRVLVEASPPDSLWGIGLPATNPDVHHPTKWRGQNLLGFALMKTRKSLLL